MASHHEAMNADHEAMNAEVQRIERAFRAAKSELVLVITGAGISAASGIPTFRGTDPDAIWKRDVTELGTFGFFLRDPVTSWQWYQSRFEKVFSAKPNPGHEALARLEAWQVHRGGRFLLITQNIDTLHEQAGSHNLVKVHGTCDRVRCSREGCRRGAPSGSILRSETEIDAFLRDPRPETLPRCPDCGSVLRQHVLWFDETYDSHEDYQIERILNEADRAGLFLFIGTSFSVGITDILLHASRRRGVPVFSVDPGGTAPPRSVEPIRLGAEIVLPALYQALAGHDDPSGGTPT